MRRRLVIGEGRSVHRTVLQSKADSNSGPLAEHLPRVRRELSASTTVLESLLQVLFALLYYIGLVVIMRLSGKRLAGQTTTFDLVVLITLGVVLQSMALRKGELNALLFLATVFIAHRMLALVCARSPRVRRLVRGAPRPLVRGGEVSWQALDDENLSYEDLLAGLRKLGYDGPRAVRVAILEETGHISAIAAESPAASERAPQSDAGAAHGLAQGDALRSGA